EAKHELEPEDALVEADRAVEIRHLEVDVADVGRGIDRRCHRTYGSGVCARPTADVSSAVVVEAVLQPRGPYALALSARGDATRRFRDGLLSVTLPEGLALAWQRPDRRVVVRAPSDEAVERMRFVLAIDADHTPFLRAHRRDPLLGPMTATLPWLRPLRLTTVAHVLLRAFCGQLISARDAREIEFRIITAACPRHDRLRTPPTAADLVRLSPAKLRSLGLHARRGAS